MARMRQEMLIMEEEEELRREEERKVCKTLIVFQMSRHTLLVRLPRKRRRKRKGWRKGVFLL
jgi:hypothetical protein